MNDTRLANINTALLWTYQGGVLNFDQMTNTLWIMDDSEFADNYKDSGTELTESDYSYELCKSTLQMAFHEDYIVEAGMDWENSERFRKILTEMKKECQH